MKKQRFNYWYTNYRTYWTIRRPWMDFCEWIAKHCPVHIPTRRPKPPEELCECGKKLTRMIAYDTGDGYEIDWICEDDCGFAFPVVGWWPFWFGAWAKDNDFEKVGIEAV